MKKLRLELDELEVESFSTLTGEKERATVEGQQQSASVPVACICVSNDDVATCDTTCNPNDCFTCNGGFSCPADCTATCIPRRC